MRASTELDNLLDAGTDFRTGKDGRFGHYHSEATGDFHYFDTIFKIGNEYYSGIINIMPIKKGLLLKDITEIKNVTEEIHRSYGAEPPATILRDVSNNISQNVNSVNTSDEIDERISHLLGIESLKEENKALIRRNSYLERRLREVEYKVKAAKFNMQVDITKVDGFIRGLAKEYGAKIDVKATADTLAEAYNNMINDHR